MVAYVTRQILVNPASYPAFHQLVMTAFDKLPYETLIQILAGLPIADLAHTSLVCRRLSAVAESLLYQTPSLDALRTRDRRPSLECFLETLVSSRGQILVTHVRSLSVRWDHSSRLDAVTYAGAGWLIGFLRPVGFHGTHCVLLLHLLPSVRVLQINPPRDIPSLSQSYITHCLEPVDSAPHAGPGRPTLQLQSLREFSCPYERNRGGITFRALLALVNLPCIVSIDTYIVDTDTFYPPPSSDDGARFSPLTKLGLSVSTTALPLSSLPFFLNSPAVLTHFSYRPLGGSEFRIVDFMATLCPMQASLEWLHLDLISVSVVTAVGKDDRIRSSFYNWPVLHTLSCSLEQLLGPIYASPHVYLLRVLPRGLRGLQILPDRSWSYDTVMGELVNLLRQKPGVPVLERISVEAWPVQPYYARALLREGCENAGVRLVGGDSFGW